MTNNIFFVSVGISIYTGKSLSHNCRINYSNVAYFKQIKHIVKIFFVSGEVDGNAREEIRHIVEKESNAIIVASFGTFSTGVNIKKLHNIVFCSPSKSRIRVLQSIGRGLRTAEEKQVCTLFDIADNMQWRTKKNYTLQHFAERIKMYNEEKFKYKLYKVALKN